MTAVASPPTFPQHNRSGPWASLTGGHAGAPEDRMFMPRKSLQRNNSSSSISSTSSTSSTSTVSNPASHAQPNGVLLQPSPGDLGGSWSNGGSVQAEARKRPQPKSPWPPQKQDAQMDPNRPGARANNRAPFMGAGVNGAGPMHTNPSQILPSQGQVGAQQGTQRPMPDSLPGGPAPVLYLLSLNGTFERKTISVPFLPDTLRIGRQTNAKTVPTPINGFFDSKVLSRQHAEIYADRQGKIWIRDVKSSNGTFVNGSRLSQENRESDPHELQTGDHLELGIDIVSEDQKTVVHHKVAAKVEHAGYLNSANNVLDMNFGDLDPTNGGMMMQPQGVAMYRGRAGSQVSMTNNGRMVAGGGFMGGQPNGMNHQRGFFFSPISTEQIVKRLQNEMRTARLQTHDLSRTGQFISTLLTKDDIKDLEKVEVHELSKSQMVNGNGVSFRSDGGKTRFSDPPAPPPQQPLPEKPDVPSLKRGLTEKPKLPGQSNSPVRHDGHPSQILQLTEALKNAQKEIESQTSRMKELEEMLDNEKRARALAEDLARRLEVAAITQPEEVANKPEAGPAILTETFEPPPEQCNTADPDTPMTDPEPEQADHASELQSQIETMVLQMSDLRCQLESLQERASSAESERDLDRKSLAEMALQLREEAEAREALARENAQLQVEMHAAQDASATSGRLSRSSTLADILTIASTDDDDERASETAKDRPAMTRTNTITPLTASAGVMVHEHALTSSIPYASMVGVVMIGMGLMAYINGWQAPPRVER
ncbi:FHA domain-containing protein [Microdochium nivale]|nr:FHA domain-containing protein [Microdochium nivale]